MNKWPLKQLDVSNAFLHGNVEEDLYMSQPQGYIDSTHPQYVCKLNRSLYGLKQAPRASFSRLTQCLHSLKFVSSKADNSLFILKQTNHFVFLLVYVDDIVVTGSCPKLIQSIIQALQSIFQYETWVLFIIF